MSQNVTDMSYMFYQTSIVISQEYVQDGVPHGLSSLDLSNFNTSSVTNMSYMFGNCIKISSLNLSQFNMINVISKTGMCRYLSTRAFNYDDVDLGVVNCIITCPELVQTAMQSGTALPTSTSGVRFIWVRP